MVEKFVADVTQNRPLPFTPDEYERIRGRLAGWSVYDEVDYLTPEIARVLVTEPNIGDGKAVLASGVYLRYLPDARDWAIILVSSPTLTLEELDVELERLEARAADSDHDHDCGYRDDGNQYPEGSDDAVR